MKSPYLPQILEIERMRGALELHLSGRSSGSDTDTEAAIRTVSGALGACGVEIAAEEVGRLARGGPLGEGRAPALALGYLELHRLVVAHHSEIPFLENQIKYFHSILLRHDASALSHRRMYRRSADGDRSSSAVEAPPAEAVPGLMAMLVGQTREALEDGARHPLIAAAEFFRDFLEIRPFASGNRLLALGLADYLLLRNGYDHVLIEPLEPAIESRREVLAEATAGRAATSPDEADRCVAHFLEAVADSQRRALDSLAPRPAVRISARQERILAILSDRGAAKIGDILAVVDIPRATLKKDLRELVACRRIVATGIRKGTVYRIWGS